MAKSKGRLLAELLASDGKIKESKSALEISGGKIKAAELPQITNSQLENSSITIAGESTALGASVSLNTGHITEHTNFKYHTDARVRAAISASGDIAYNSTTGVISFSQAAGAVVSVNGTTGSVVLDTGDIAENGNLYHTTARARASISATGNAISYNSSTGVITSNYEESPTFTGHVSVQGNLNVGNSSAGNLIFKRPSANYIWADQTSGYFIFGTNARGTSYANRAMALTADNDANFGRDVNVVRQVSAPIYYDSDNTARYFDGSGTSVFGNVSVGGSAYTTSADLNLLGDGLAIKNDKAGSSNNWSLIQNTDTGSASNLSFTTGLGVALTLNHNKSATFGSAVDVTGNLTASQSLIGVSGFVQNLYITSSGTSALNRIDNDGSSLYVTYGGVTNRALEINNTSGDSTFKQDVKILTDNFMNFGGGGATIKHASNSRTYFAGGDIEISTNSFRLFNLAGTTGMITATTGGVNFLQHVNVAADLVVGSGGLNKAIKVRHINGKDHDSDDMAGLYLNYSNNMGVFVGSTSELAELDVYGSYKSGAQTIVDSSRNFRPYGRVTFTYNDHYLEAGTGTVTFKSNSNASLVTLGQASTFNGTVKINSHVSGIGDIDFGKAIAGHSSSSPARITASSTGQLYIDSTNGQHIYLGWYNGSSVDVLSEMNARFASYKDRNDTAYLLNPAGASNIRDLVIKGTTSDSSTYALNIKNSGGTTQSYFRNDGTVVIQGSQYLYVTASGGLYVNNSIKARGGILNDQGDLLLNDTVQVAGPLVIQGSGSQERYLAFTLDGKNSAFSGSNNAFIFNGQGSSGDYLAGALYFQSRSNAAEREIGFITGTTPAKRLVVNNSGITVTGTITGDLTGSVTGTVSSLSNHTTQNLTEHSSNLYYTDARVGTYLSGNGYDTAANIKADLVDSAPALLNTLDELALAIGDDENFSTTITTSIATKLPLAGGTMSGNLIIASASSPTLRLQDTTNTTKLLHYAQDSNAISGTYSNHPYLLYSNSGHVATLSTNQTATYHNILYSDVSMRAPIFYDKDNAAFYMNPAGTSVINSSTFGGYLSSSASTSYISLGSYLKLYAATGSNTGTISINATYDGAQTDSWTPIYSGDANAGMFMLRQSSGGSGVMQVLQKQHGTTSSSTGRGTFTKTAEFHHGGYFYGRNIRSEAFYDESNTDFYVDPVGTSKLYNTLYLGHTNTQPGSLVIYDTGNNGLEIKGTGSNTFQFDMIGTGSIGTININDFLVKIPSQASIGTTNAPSSGYSLRTGSIQMHGAGSLDYISQLHFNDNVRFYQDGNDQYLNYKWGDTGAGGIKFLDGNTALQGYVYGHNQNFGLLSADGSWAVQTTNAKTMIHHRVDTPIFYDMDDTTYYVTPASTSTALNVAGRGYFRGAIHSGSDSNTPGAVYINDNSTTAYTLGIIGTGTREFEFRGSSSGGDYISSFTNPSTGGHKVVVQGNITHNGLTMTSGSDVDQLYTVTVSAQLTTSWQDTGINGTDLSTGTYIVQIYVDGDVPRRHYQEFYSGVMSWTNAETNSNEADEIPLHRAGHAPNAGNVFLRTLRHPSGGDRLMLQIRGTENFTSASNYIFKFRRMI